MRPTFSVIVPTLGRKTLVRTLASVAPQLREGDEILTLRADCAWGNASRDTLARRAGGSHLLFLDDDDVFLEDALETFRYHVAEFPKTIHVCRMQYADGMILWGAPEFRAGNVGTPMVAIPNLPEKLGRWENPHGQLSDFAFFAETLRRLGTLPIFHPEVVALVRPLEYAAVPAIEPTAGELEAASL